MKVIIQSHFPERRANLEVIRKSLIMNGIQSSDILFLIDYPFGETKYNLIQSSIDMPINWWHTVASILDTDYVALICDDISLKPNSLSVLQELATEVNLVDNQPEFDVFGYEGATGAGTHHPYTDSATHTVTEITPVEFIIRFYFARPEAFVRALELYHKVPPELRGHDDLLLSLSNKCLLVPTTEESGLIDLEEHEVAYSKRPTHYEERNKLIETVRRGEL